MFAVEALQDTVGGYPYDDVETGRGVSMSHAAAATLGALSRMCHRLHLLSGYRQNVAKRELSRDTK
jgi:hypothetical protein